MLYLTKNQADQLKELHPHLFDKIKFTYTNDPKLMIDEFGFAIIKLCLNTVDFQLNLSDLIKLNGNLNPSFYLSLGRLIELGIIEHNNNIISFNSFNIMTHTNSTFLSDDERIQQEHSNAPILIPNNRFSKTTLSEFTKPLRMEILAVSSVLQAMIQQDTNTVADKYLNLLSILNAINPTQADEINKRYLKELTILSGCDTNEDDTNDKMLKKIKRKELNRYSSAKGRLTKKMTEEVTSALLKNLSENLIGISKLTEEPLNIVTELPVTPGYSIASFHPLNATMEHSSNEIPPLLFTNSFSDQNDREKEEKETSETTFDPSIFFVADPNNLENNKKPDLDAEHSRLFKKRRVEQSDIYQPRFGFGCN